MQHQYNLAITGPGVDIVHTQTVNLYVIRLESITAQAFEAAIRRADKLNTGISGHDFNFNALKTCSFRWR